MSDLKAMKVHPTAVEHVKREAGGIVGLRTERLKVPAGFILEEISATTSLPSVCRLNGKGSRVLSHPTMAAGERWLLNDDIEVEVIEACVRDFGQDVPEFWWVAGVKLVTPKRGVVA